MNKKFYAEINTGSDAVEYVYFTSKKERDDFVAETDYTDAVRASEVGDAISFEAYEKGKNSSFLNL